MERILTKEIKDLDNLIGKSLKANNDIRHVLNRTQLQIIFYLNKHINEEVCQKDLEIETHLKKASITGALDSLEDKDIIVRKQSKDDKRKNVIILSKAALKEKDRIENKFKQIELKIKKNIDEDELKQFYSTLDKMKSNLN